MENEMRKLGADFSKDALWPRWKLLDGTDSAVREAVLERAEAAGIPGFAIPGELGGSGLGAADYCAFLEEVSRASGGAGALLAAHFAGLAPLLLSGNDCASGPLRAAAGSQGAPRIFALAIKEHPADPDLIPDRVDTYAENTARGVVVTGMKTRVAGAGVSAYFTVLAANGDGLCWVVAPRDAPGVEVMPETARMGLKFCPVNDVRFDRVEVASENVTKIFDGPVPLLEYYRFIDPVFASVAIGIAAQARDMAVAYALQRRQGGKMICDHDLVRLMLADMDARIAASRALAYGGRSGLLGFALAAECAEQVCLDAVQVHGGYGYMKDYRAERLLRDAKTLQATAAPRARRLEHINREIQTMR